MKKQILFTLPLALLLLGACSKKLYHGPIEFEPEVSFDLAHEDTGHYSQGNLSITFVDVTENVHPSAGVPDVWEGESRIQLDVESSSGAQSIELIYRLTKSSFDRDTVGNYEISLMQVSPDPQGEPAIEKQDYSIQLMVRAL